ncbi:MAG: competence/damage-inducible protein A [Bacteroidetes bacterium]|nr:competence/damage-inducible protein A [Bacteroidota bacterium]
MKTEIINIGDELLIGQVINTNAAWMAVEMNLAGFMIDRVTVIQDETQAILGALEQSRMNSDIILITGGLGPTKDDITKEALCQFFNTTLAFNLKAFENIERFFHQRGISVTELNRKQAELPENCTPVHNQNGTAPGMWFETTRDRTGEKVIIISLPGVPFEMKSMMKDLVIPMLKIRFPQHTIIHKTIMTQGIGESFLADLIEEWETQLPSNISLAYLPHPGIVRLRLTGIGNHATNIRKQIEEESQKLQKIIPHYIYGYDDEQLEETVGRLLKERKLSVATAESCTGGYIAHLITSVPGCSVYFKGSIIAYANEIKEKELGVSAESLFTFGAVSEQVVKAMASGIMEKFKVDLAIATSGIAGPDGGTDEKPVGMIWIAIASPSGITARKYQFGDNRDRNIRRTAMQALNLLRKTVIGEPF